MTRDLSGERLVLLVKSETETSQFLQDNAAKYQYKAQVLRSTEDLLAVQRGSQAALLLDLDLPEADGIDLIHALGRERARMPLILMSGLGVGLLHAAHQLATWYGLQILGDLAKPFAISDMMAMLRSFATRNPEGEKTAESPWPGRTGRGRPLPKWTRENLGDARQKSWLASPTGGSLTTGCQEFPRRS